jgi:quercetin dioxygenase-like cupin family protein
MKRSAMMLTVTLVLGSALGVISRSNAQQAPIKRTEVLRSDMAGMPGKEAHMWVADIAPGAATGLHRHPTPRFVYVISGAVTLEIEGQPPRTFRAGEGFQEMPGEAHNFRNASTTESARALGFQIAGKGEPLQF